MTTAKVRLGGNIAEAKAEQEAYPNISWVWIDLPTGETLSLFYNAETRLFVADVMSQNGGIEFVRATVPEQ